MLPRTLRTWLPALVVAVLLVGARAESRELRVDPDDLVEVELAGIGVSSLAGAPVVLLRHLETGDVVPILVGLDQARAILMAMHGIEPPRPMTHDLTTTLITALGATLDRVLVDELDANTFLGMLELNVPGNSEPLRIDTRPSDGLALAVRTGASIHVAPEVLIAGEGMEYEGLPDRQVVTALGITAVEAGPEQRAELGLPDLPGVLVRRLVGDARRSGMEPGSLITEVNGNAVDSPMGFLEEVEATEPGEDVHLRYWYEGEERTLELPPESGRPDQRQPAIRA